MVGRRLRFADGTTARVYRETRRAVATPGGAVSDAARFDDGVCRAARRDGEVRVDGLPHGVVVGGAALVDPVALAVTFRLRRVSSPGWHAAFRAESLLNTVLFVGFEGFVSKLWCGHDERGRYRGVYQWDGARAAEAYVASLHVILTLVSEPGSIHHVVIPGCRDDLVAFAVPPAAGDDGAWWCPAAVRTGS